MNVYIYSLLPDNSIRVVYTPYRENEDTMHFNLFEHHLTYVQNVVGFLKKIVCETCDRVFHTKFHKERHKKTCLNIT